MLYEIRNAQEMLTYLNLPVIQEEIWDSVTPKIM